MISLAEAAARLGHLDGRDLIAAVTAAWPGRIAVISSFGAESAVLLDLVASIDRTIPVITLDTGELFDETVEYICDLSNYLGLRDVRIVRPGQGALAEAEDLWRSNPDRCCELRKVLPLERAVAGFEVLIDGRKQMHGFERENLTSVAVSGAFLKVSPLARWDEHAIDAAFHDRDLPRHPLVELGYRSIGCWPCTRVTAPGEAPRAGRWAGCAKTECGIHTRPLRAAAKD